MAGWCLYKCVSINTYNQVCWSIGFHALSDSMDFTRFQRAQYFHVHQQPVLAADFLQYTAVYMCTAGFLYIVVLFMIQFFKLRLLVPDMSSHLLS